MEKMPSKIFLYLVMLLIVAVSLKMKEAPTNAEGMPGGGQQMAGGESGAPGKAPMIHFEEGLPPAVPIFLEFSSPSCDICKQMKPMLERLMSEYAGRIAYVDISVNDANTQGLADAFGVDGFPSFYVLNNKVEQQQLTHFEGSVPEEMLRKLLDQLAEFGKNAATDEGNRSHGGEPAAGEDPHSGGMDGMGEGAPIPGTGMEAGENPHGDMGAGTTAPAGK